MTRALVLCGVLLAVGSEASAASLQSALTTSLTGLQAAQTTIAGNGANLNATVVLEVIDLEQQRREEALSRIASAVDRFEGGEFIDPLASTVGQGLFGPGPQLTYDPQTGGATITAPPLLGPADEFGLRREYTPNSITIHGNGRLAETVSLPQTDVFDRNVADPGGQLSVLPSGQVVIEPPMPLTDESPSFVLANQSFPTSSVEVLEDEITIRRQSRRAFGAIITSFDQLFEPQLEVYDFQPAPELLTQDGVAVSPGVSFNALEFDEFLPSVYAVVNYSLVNRDLVFDLRISNPIPRSFTVIATPTVVPEPSAAVLVLLGFATASLPRRLAPRVA